MSKLYRMVSGRFTIIIDANLLAELGFDLDCETWEVERDTGLLQVILWDSGPEGMFFGNHIAGPETADELRTLLKALGVTQSC